MEMEYIPASNAILLSVSEATAAMLDELTMEFNSILDSEGISYSSDNGIFVETVDNDAEKWMPIIISLLSGAVLGLVLSLV